MFSIGSPIFPSTVFIVFPLVLGTTEQRECDIISQTSTLTQNDIGPVGPVTPSTTGPAKCLLALYFFFNVRRKNKLHTIHHNT